MKASTFFWTLASCCVGAGAAGCGPGEALTLELERPPRAEVRELDDGEVFTGRLLVAEASSRRDGATLDLTELRDGQIVSEIPSAYDDGVPVLERFDPGVFKLGGSVTLDADADVQLVTTRVTYGFETGELELERSSARVLRAGDADVPIEVVLLSGLGELQIVTQRLANELAATGGAVTVVPVDVELVAVDALGSGDYVSNVVTYDVELCNGCAEVTTQTFTSGSGVRP